MQQTDWRLLLVGGEAEGDRLDRLGTGLPPERVRVARSLPLAELARQMTACRAFLGHDSGISHLAAAISLPSIALWGTTQEAVWRPPSPTFRILRHPGGMGGIQPVDVLAALNDLLDLSPVT
jgi:heptosyltransferase-2